MWELDHKAQHQKTDTFKLWCWRRLLRGPWTAKRSNQSILKEMNPDYSLEGLMLKLNLQYSGHLMGRSNSLEKTLMLRKIEGKRRRSQQRMTWLDSIANSKDMNLSKLQEIVKDREVWWAAVHGVVKSWVWLSDWKTTARRLSGRTSQTSGRNSSLGGRILVPCVLEGRTVKSVSLQGEGRGEPVISSL